MQTKWLRKRKLPADLVAAGEFEEALNLLKRRLGVMNADPLQPLFQAAYWATCSAFPGLPGSASLMYPLLSDGHGKSRDLAPITLCDWQSTLERVKEGYKLFLQGKFAEALQVFRAVLQSIALGVAKDAQEENQFVEMIGILKEYVNGMRLEVTRKTLDPSDVVRNLELSAYWTCCKMQNSHLILTLRVAMAGAFKAQNFVLAAAFAKRLVQSAESNTDPQTLAQAKKLLQVCEAKGTDAHAIKFNPKQVPQEFKLCAGSLTPIDPKDVSVNCPFCGASFHASYKGKLCGTCELSEVGANTLGIQLRPL
jgi:coatomer protein complex subunit alpha (xenin)